NTSFVVRFTVAGVFRWLAVAALSVSLVLFAAHAFAQAASSTHANATGLLNRADNGRNRIADDLNRVLNGQGTGHENWIRRTPGGPQYSVIVTANAAATRNDRQLNGLRHAILAMGGAINRKFTSINGVAATVPAARLRELSQRADVFRITPNRLVARAASMLEMVTGADGVRGQ